MEMHQIRYFLAVCTERNFTRAARLCRVSQPSLTRAIKLLEAEFGGILFRRERASSHLTELGEIVRHHLQEVWEQSHAAICQAHEFASVKRDKLKVGVMCSIAPKLLVDLLTRMRKRHTVIELQIVDGSASDLHEQLLTGEISAAIYGRPTQQVDANFIHVPMFRERMLIAAPRNHRLANHTSIRLADLAGEQYVWRPRCEFNTMIEALLKQHKIEYQTSVSSDRDDWALTLIARGFGLGLLPQHTINRPDVVARPLAEPELWREVNLVILREHPRTDGLSTLMDEARQLTHAFETASTVEERLLHERC